MFCACNTKFNLDIVNVNSFLSGTYHGVKYNFGATPTAISLTEYYPKT